MDTDDSDLTILLVPGLQNSGPEHWQSRWQRRYPPARRVEQAQWDVPDLAIWSERLDVARRASARVLLVAHSFGCLASVHRIAADLGNIAGALLVAPADPEKFGVVASLPQRPLACPSLLISSRDDPWMRADSAARWAERWGSVLVDGGALGHINADSQLADWPFGQAQLRRLLSMLDAPDHAITRAFGDPAMARDGTAVRPVGS